MIVHHTRGSGLVNPNSSCWSFGQESATIEPRRRTAPDPEETTVLRRFAWTALAWTLLAIPGLADDPAKFADVPLPAGLVAPNTAATAAATVCFLEGPAVDDKGTVYFSDISGNRILKMTTDGTVSVFRADSGRTNGNTFDAQGRLISCEGAENGPGGRRRIVRTDLKTGDVT